MRVRELKSAPLASEFLGALEATEGATRTVNVPFAELAIGVDGKLAAGRHEYNLSPDARRQLGRLMSVRNATFDDLAPDTDLLNELLSRRLRRQLASSLLLNFSKNSADRIDRITVGNVPKCSTSQVLSCALTAADDAKITGDIRAICYPNNDATEIALISSEMNVEVVSGDFTFGGVHILSDNEGSVQVGTATWRLVCANGAMMRVHSEQQKPCRIRRANNDLDGSKLLADVANLSLLAWRSWAATSARITELTKEPLGDTESILTRLRGRPFFVSKKTAQLVRNLLVAAGRHLTLYDLLQALTDVGTHGPREHGVRNQYAHRLRLGGGALLQSRVRLCRACQQFVLVN